MATSAPSPSASAGATTSRATRGPARSLWWTRRALVAHVALAVWVPGCALAAWWQVGIALGGDSLGWVYSVMWPCFAVFGIVFWWFLVHDDPDTLGARGLRRQREAAAAAGAAEGASAAAAGAAVPAGTEATHADASTAAASDGTPVDAMIADAEAEDPELAEYNAYLAQLAGQPKSWRRR